MAMNNAMKQPARLQSFYNDEIVPSLVQRFGYSSVMAAPRVTKITLNMGLGEAVADRKVVQAAMAEMAIIAGQQPVMTRARKSVAGFKIREGWPIGCKVTLRRGRMYEFLDRLVQVTLPRIRDFRGLSPKSFDGRGNYSLGVREQLVFPEIDFDKVETIRGMDVVISTSATNDEEGRALLDGFQFPFRK